MKIKTRNQIIVAASVVVIGFLAIFFHNAIVPDQHPAKLSGVYSLDLGLNTVLTVDLRSDGSALDSGTPATWMLEGNKIYVDHDGKRWTYKIEGDDLLDSRGNRWIRKH